MWTLSGQSSFAVRFAPSSRGPLPSDFGATMLPGGIAPWAVALGINEMLIQRKHRRRGRMKIKEPGV